VSRLVLNIWFSRSVERKLSGRDTLLTIPHAVASAVTTNRRAIAHKKYRLYLWRTIAKDTCQPGSGEVLAAWLDGQTGYVEVGFRA
jgi:hypothetical protein